MKETLSSKIVKRAMIERGFIAKGTIDYYIPTEDVREFIKKLKEEFWCQNEQKFIDNLSGEELINDNSPQKSLKSSKLEGNQDIVKQPDTEDKPLKTNRQTDKQTDKKGCGKNFLLDYFCGEDKWDNGKPMLCQACSGDENV